MEKEHYSHFIDSQPGSSRKQNPKARMKLLTLFGSHKSRAMRVKVKEKYV